MSAPARTPRFGPALLAPALAVFVLTACVVTSGGSGAGGTAVDTLRGTVAVTGADPLTHVVLRTDAGAVDVQGPGAELLRSVNGLEVMVEGHRAGSTLTARAFRVREADGLPAADGVLEVEGDTAILVTPGGERLAYTPIPSALRARAGQRVWIAGVVGSEPRAWGVIGP